MDDSLEEREKQTRRRALQMKGYEISFSPTGGTQRAAGILAERLLDAIVPVDLTDGRDDFSSISLEREMWL